MGKFLDFLKRSDGRHLIEPAGEGFAVVRRSVADAHAFNEFAREIVRKSGDDYVALPRTDGRAGYDRVFIIPLD